MSVGTSLVPSVGTAPLPQRYEAAKLALSECSQVDECKDWADKAEALASYARQADDQTLYRLALRIKDRAIRRAGELLKTFQDTTREVSREAAGTFKREGDHPLEPRTQREAAEAAGMSKWQEKQAVRVANVPEQDFEALVESEDPPTVTALANLGKQTLPDEPLYRPKPEGFTAATHTLGALERFAEKCRENPPELVAGGVMPNECDDARKLVSEVDAWLDRFVINLGGSAE